MKSSDFNATSGTTSKKYDAIVVGGGPGGSTCARSLAKLGLSVLMIEKDRHPRFHIGESILPRTELLLRELGLSEKVRTLPHLPKMGAEFGFGNSEKTLKFGFTDGLLPGFPIFNIERAKLDELLFEEAGNAGVEIRDKTAVKSIDKLDDDDVAVTLSDGTQVRGRVLMDASGHGTIVARHLGTRQNMTDPELQKVAYFGHFENVEQLTGDYAGHPGIFMCDEGWFWMIGISPTVTSVGFVSRPSFVKQLSIPADQMLNWAIQRCPIVRHRMRSATGPARNDVLADFSYTCKPFAGKGHFLIGDAACFLDPIFSTGVTLAMIGGHEAAKEAAAMLKGGQSPARAQKRYHKFVKNSTGIFWGLIKGYYKHAFRELFMEGQGPHQVHKAVISVLAGQVYPKPRWCLRWRLALFHLCVKVQEWVPLAPRKPHFSLMRETPVSIPTIRDEAEATPTHASLVTA